VKTDLVAFRFQRNFWLKWLIDILLFAVAFYMAFAWRYDFAIPLEQFEYLKALLIPIVIIKLTVFYFSRVYDISWHYASVMDFFRVALANVIATLAIAVLIYAAFQLPIARGVIALDGLLALTFTAGVRFSYRLVTRLRYQLFWSSGVKPVLIIGAGDTGVEIAREMLRSTRLNVRPVGFIDDDRAKQGSIVQGLRVLGTRHKLADTITKYNIVEVIICMPSASRAVIRDVFMTCRAAGVKCRTLPGIYQLISGAVSIEQIRDVQVEDILGREPVAMDLEKIADYIRGKKVMVVGAGGSIGSELCRQINQLQPAALIMLDQSEGGLFEIEQELIAQGKRHLIIPVIADITNRNRISAVFKQRQPSVIFHAAAYKHVPMMEANLVEAAENNIIGSMILCEEAIACGAEKFVLISTDKAVEPVCNMGKAKAVAEKVVQHFAGSQTAAFISVRFGNVLDSSGSVVPTFRRQIAAGGPVCVTHPEMRRYFMTIPEAVHLVIQAAVLGKGGEIFILDMGEQISILELARSMIRLSGLEPDEDIAIEFSGVRPGEKLYEKLFWDDEESLTTENPNILAAKNCNWDFSSFEQEIRQLESAIKGGDEDALRAIIDDICSQRCR
jgi:FlaA1/EpsC-like NDP-sugar epimerase